MSKTFMGLVLASMLLLGEGDALEGGELDEAGWLARALASTDPDVDAAIEAYAAGELERALEHLDAAIVRRGSRPELSYDRGLVLLAMGDSAGASQAFLHGSESQLARVAASSHYELGNLAMAGEQWEPAISHYIDCLRLDPEHQNAKWNLELALQRKREQEKQEQEQQDQQNQDQQNQDQQNQDQQNQDQQNQDQQNQDQQNQDQQNQDQQNQDQQQQDQQGQGEQEQQDQAQQDQQQQDQQDQQGQDQQQPQPQQQQDQQPQAQPIESGDLDAALDQLDQRDDFMFGRPRSSQRPVEKDW